MFRSLASKIPQDHDLPERAWNLDVLSRVLNGTLYDVLEYAFGDERTPGGEYVKLAERRPSVRYGLSRVVVEDSISLLFGEGRFPDLTTENKDSAQNLADIVKDARLNQVMAEAALLGSVGSVAVWLRVLKGRLFVKVLPTKFLTPAFDPEAPDVLLSVTERYKVKGRVLRASGYTINDQDMAKDHWFQRIWDQDAETWFLPQSITADDKPMQIDTTRTVKHSFGFVPMVWIRNLPGGDDVDGACTFRPAVETSIEIDYQLSQAGRGLKYSSDPTLLIKEPAAPDMPMLGGAANALVVSEKGDAKLLEIGGTASAAVIEYVRVLREMALESVHGNRSNADKVSAAQSGRALEMLHQPLIWLADNLRISYGEVGLLGLVRMIVAASHIYPLTVAGKTIKDLPDEPIGLRWPQWFSPTNTDLQAQAATLSTLRTAGMISRETAIGTIANDYDIEDPAVEMAQIAKDEADADARELKQAQAQTKITETAPG